MSAAIINMAVVFGIVQLVNLRKINLKANKFELDAPANTKQALHILPLQYSSYVLWIRSSRHPFGHCLHLLQDQRKER